MPLGRSITMPGPVSVPPSRMRRLESSFWRASLASAPSSCAIWVPSCPCITLPAARRPLRRHARTPTRNWSLSSARHCTCRESPSRIHRPINTRRASPLNHASQANTVHFARAIQRRTLWADVSCRPSSECGSRTVEFGLCHAPGLLLRRDPRHWQAGRSSSAGSSGRLISAISAVRVGPPAPSADYADYADRRLRGSRCSICFIERIGISIVAVGAAWSSNARGRRPARRRCLTPSGSATSSLPPRFRDSSAKFREQSGSALSDP
jgi:hypothetical protein